MSKKPKILIWDIEIAPHKISGFYWDNPKWNNAIDYDIIETSSILTIAYKWYKEKTTHVLSVDPKNVRDDKKIVQDFSKILDEADFMVHHYGDKFDYPFFNGRVLMHGLKPINKPISIDTYKHTKSKFLLRMSNRLDYLGEITKNGQKIKTDWNLWKGCMEGNPKSLSEMGKYNKQDVVLLEKVFTKLLPHFETKLNMGLSENGIKECCPSCGSDKIQKHGLRRTLTKLYHRLHCTDCGKIFKGGLIL